MYKLRVVHIVEGFLGGLSRYLCLVLPRLVREGFEATLICSLHRSSQDARGRLSQLRASGVKVYIVPMCRQISFGRDLRAFIVILRLLSRNRFDIVHTHCSKAGALGRVAAILRGCRIRLHSPHCFAFLRAEGRLGNQLYLALERLLGKITTLLIAVSKTEAEIAIRYKIVPADKCVWVNNGLPDSAACSADANKAKFREYKKALGLKLDTPVVATGCRLVGYKGVFRFLEAAMLSRRRDVIFLLAGDGPLRAKAERFVEENNLCSRVRILGHVSNMGLVYGASDVIVLCSDAEAQPYLLLEAMRARRAIVATSVIGNKELIKHRQTGLLVEPTARAVAAAVDELLADEHKRKTYAENAYAYFRCHHRLDKQVSKMVDLYRQCIREGRLRAATT